MDALRQGIPTHSFQRNHVPLEKTKLPMHVALSLKNALWGMKRNITVCITMFVLSLVVVFSGLMLENMILDRTPFCNLVLGEAADSCINIAAEAEEEFLQKMQKDPRVEKIYLYDSQGVSHVGGTGLLATFCDDFSKVNNPGVMLEGRFPEFDNEVALGLKYARGNGWDIGKEIRLSAEGKEASYIISGFTQISNNLGKDCLLTREGYGKMGQPDSLSYYLNLSEDVVIDDFHKEVNETFGREIIKTVDISSAMDATLDVYVSLMQMIVIAILLLSVVIISFVLYLLVRAMIGSKKRDYGILKAVGFTTRQLMFQTALSFMPAVVVSMIVGLVGSCFAINPLVAVFLKGIGIIKCTFQVPVGFVTAAGIGLVLFAFAAVCLMSLRIRKMVPQP